MKKVTVMMTCLITLAVSAEGQLKHYLSVNKVYYWNFHNKEKDKPEDIEGFFSLPITLSYRVGSGRWGAELWYTQTTTFYKPIKMGQINPGDISFLYQDIVCLNVQYAAFQHKRINVNPFLGIIYREYQAEVFDEWLPYNPYHPGQNSRSHYEEENQIALQTGANINVPIYWGIYTNVNLRHNAIPWARYNKHNFLVEFGLGYCIQRKRKSAE